MANAAMLVVGGGSYATYGALACRGSVRMPRCVLKFSEQQDCAPPGARLAVRLHAYDHPRCTCLDSVNASYDGLAPANVTNATSVVPPWRPRIYHHRTEPWRPPMAYKTRKGRMIPGTRLPARDANALQRALQLSEGVYTAAPSASGDAPPNTTASAVLVTSFNAAYLDLYLNWACHARSHGLRHLVWLQDRATAVRLRDHYGTTVGGSLSADPELEASASDRMRILPPAPSTVERPHGRSSTRSTSHAPSASRRGAPPSARARSTG